MTDAEIDKEVFNSVILFHTHSNLSRPHDQHWEAWMSALFCTRTFSEGHIGHSRDNGRIISAGDKIFY